MKFNVLQENLKNSLSYLQKVIPTKPQITVLSSILLQVKNKKLILSATDLYLGIKTELLVETEDQGELIVNGELLKNIVNSLENGKINFEYKENFLIVTQGKTKSRLACQNSTEFPSFPVVEGDSFTLNIEDLEKIQTAVTFCASPDQSRPVLTALLFKFSKLGLEVVATDGFRLSNLFLKTLNAEQTRTILIPAKALNELYRIAKQTEVESVQIFVAEELKQLLFKINQVEMYVRLIEGDYPPYEKIIPPEFSLNLEFDGVEFLTQLKRAAIFSRDVSNIVKLSIEKDKMVISSQSPSLGEYSGEILIKNDAAEEGEIAFNVNYLIDFMNALKPETLIFGMNESLKPAIFKNKNVQDYFYIAMPFRVNS